MAKKVVNKTTQIKKAGKASPPAKTKPSVSTGFGYVAQAMKENASIETIQKLIEYEKVLETERIRREYILAMRELQNVLPPLPKTATGYNKDMGVYYYTPLSVIIEKLQPLFYKYGFIYNWDFKEVAEKIEGTIIITHKDGHSERRSMTIERDDSEQLNNIQSVGSARTYLQRYTIIAGFGLTRVEDDNDGKSVTKRQDTIPGPESISEERAELERLSLSELMLKIEKADATRIIKEKFPEIGDQVAHKFTEQEQSTIRKSIIDYIISKK